MVFRGSTRWLYALITLFSGTVVVDHSLPVRNVSLAVIDERGYQERVGSPHDSWDYGHHRSTTINATLLRLSDGTTLQLSSVGDLIGAGDTIELQRTPLLKDPLQYRKKSSRVRRWVEVDSNKLEHRIYPYLVLAFSSLLLFNWRSDEIRWSLMAGSGLMLVCWFLVMAGTGGLARLVDWF